LAEFQDSWELYSSLPCWRLTPELQRHTIIISRDAVRVITDVAPQTGCDFCDAAVNLDKVATLQGKVEAMTLAADTGYPSIVTFSDG
jgi:hypothetical protein